MGISDNSNGKNYWIVTIQSSEIKAGVAGGDLVTTALASVAVQGTGTFKPGKALQVFAKSKAVGTEEGRTAQYYILSVVASSKEDVESYCLDFDRNQKILDFDGR